MFSVLTWIYLSLPGTTCMWIKPKAVKNENANFLINSHRIVFPDFVAIFESKNSNYIC